MPAATESVTMPPPAGCVAAMAMERALPMRTATESVTAALHVGCAAAMADGQTLWMLTATEPATMPEPATAGMAERF